MFTDLYHGVESLKTCLKLNILARSDLNHFDATVARFSGCGKAGSIGAMTNYQTTGAT